MLETIIQSTDGSSFTLLNTLIVIAAAIILGFVISLVYMRTTKKAGYSPSFTITLIMLPVGYIGYAVIFTICLSLVMLILDATKFAMPKTKAMNLKIIVPEDLNYEGIFDEVLNKYSSNYHIETIRTRDFGALFELNYSIQLLEGANQKQLIDELRCRNGNLNITLTLNAQNEKVYV